MTSSRTHRKRRRKQDYLTWPTKDWLEFLRLLHKGRDTRSGTGKEEVTPTGVSQLKDAQCVMARGQPRD